MKSAAAITALLRDHEQNYAMQDNVVAAKVARILRDVIDEAEAPNLNELRRKYLGEETMDRTVLRATALRAANEKAVNINNKLQFYVMVWGRDGECRVYATEEENLHWSVPDLHGAREHYSIAI